MYEKWMNYLREDPETAGLIDRFKLQITDIGWRILPNDSYVVIRYTFNVNSREIDEMFTQSVKRAGEKDLMKVFKTFRKQLNKQLKLYEITE